MILHNKLRNSWTKRWNRNIQAFIKDIWKTEKLRHDIQKTGFEIRIYWANLRDLGTDTGTEAVGTVIGFPVTVGRVIGRPVPEEPPKSWSSRAWSLPIVSRIRDATFSWKLFLPQKVDFEIQFFFTVEKFKFEKLVNEIFLFILCENDDKHSVPW